MRNLSFQPILYKMDITRLHEPALCKGSQERIVNNEDIMDRENGNSFVIYTQVSLKWMSKIGLGIWAILGSACNWETFCGHSVCASFYAPGLFAPFHKMGRDVCYLFHVLSNALSSCSTSSSFCHSSHRCTHHPLPWQCRHWWVDLKAKEEHEYM